MVSYSSLLDNSFRVVVVVIAARAAAYRSKRRRAGEF